MIAGLRFSPEGAVERDASATVAMAVQESESALFAEFVSDDVAYGPRNEGLSGSALVDRVRFAMDLVGLPFGDFAERRTFSLSGGERRKAALAGIVAMETDIVILDEPTAALDPVSRAQVLRLIGDLRSRESASSSRRVGPMSYRSRTRSSTSARGFHSRVRPSSPHLARRVSNAHSSAFALGRCVPMTRRRVRSFAFPPRLNTCSPRRRSRRPCSRPGGRPFPLSPP
jgi:hypothetical protein